MREHGQVNIAFPHISNAYPEPRCIFLPPVQASGYIRPYLIQFPRLLCTRRANVHHSFYAGSMFCENICFPLRCTGCSFVGAPGIFFSRFWIRIHISLDYTIQKDQQPFGLARTCVTNLGISIPDKVCCTIRLTSFSNTHAFSFHSCDLHCHSC